MKILSVIFSFSFSCLCLSACGTSGTSCGQGTVEQNGSCVPEIGECGDGTVLQGDQCVPVCENNQYWDGQQCVATPECATGTTFNPASGACEPCPQGQYWDGTACAQVPTCDAGTTFNSSTGKCEPDSEACGPGTVFQDGKCVPDKLPEPDVLESSDPTGSVQFDLPAVGESVSLGGVVDVPIDLNSDGYADPDWDAFTLSVPAGTYLRIKATSEGASLPAFMVLSSETDDQGYALYARYSINPNGIECEREVYLPRADSYTILVSDYNNMVMDLFGAGAFPVGGDDFSYYVSVENLGEPSLTDIDSLPLSDAGNFGPGHIFFYNITNLATTDILTLASLGEPLPDNSSDVFPLIMLLSPDGSVLEGYAGNPAADAGIMFAVPADGDYLVIQDFLVRIGPLDDFEISAVSESVEDCTSTGCTGGALAAGEHRVLKLDLDSADYFLFNATVPSDATENLRVILYDNQMNVLSEASAGATWNRWGEMFSTNNTWIYLWLEGWTGGEVPAYDLDLVHQVTQALENGVASQDLGIVDMPDDTRDDSGIAHFIGNAGQMVVTTDMTTHGAGWTSPQIQIFSPDMKVIGPALDTLTQDLPALDPALAYVSADEYFLQLVSDPAGDITQATYDTTVYLQDLTSLGTPAAGNPVSATGQALDTNTGLAFFGYTATSGEKASLTVTPNGANLQPEIWLLEFGFHSQANWYSRADYPELGLQVANTATSTGQPAVLEHVASYNGMLVVVVRDASGSGSGDSFDINVAVIP
jgi:hypothetical protein